MCYDRHVPSYRYVIRNLTLMDYNLYPQHHNVMLFTAAHSAAQELLQVHIWEEQPDTCLQETGKAIIQLP